MEPLYSGGLLSSPVWWTRIADSHCLSSNAETCLLPACGPVYHAACTVPAGAALTTNQRSSPSLLDNSKLMCTFSECQRLSSDVIWNKLFFLSFQCHWWSVVLGTTWDVCILRKPLDIKGLSGVGVVLFTLQDRPRRKDGFQREQTCVF